MRAAVLALLIACDAGPTPTPPPTSTPPIHVVAVDAAVAVAVPIDAPAGPTLLHPVGMAGPFPTIDDACASAKPCGFSEIDDHGNESKPATKTDCALGDNDPNGSAPHSAAQPAELDHTTAKSIEMRIGSQSCTVPKGLRGEEDIYFMFVKRVDGWWRSDALWAFGYNDKYGNGTMIVRWNDQPGRTFAGVAAGLEMLECDKQGDSLTTDELMVRVEAGSAHPLVWAPLVVGRRYEQAKRDDGAPDVECPTINRSLEIVEKWTSADALELIGPATWDPPEIRDGILHVGFSSGETGPSSAGAYRFVR